MTSPMNRPLNPPLSPRTPPPSSPTRPRPAYFPTSAEDDAARHESISPMDCGPLHLHESETSSPTAREGSDRTTSERPAFDGAPTSGATAQSLEMVPPQPESAGSGSQTVVAEESGSESQKHEISKTVKDGLGYEAHQEKGDKYKRDIST